MRSKELITIACVSATIVCAVPATGQTWGVMKIGSLEGSSSLAGYEGWSDILSYNIGVQNGGWDLGRDPLPATLSDMYITKRLDKSSPLLFGAVLTGQHFNDGRMIDARVYLLRESGGPFEAFVKWDFEDVFVSAYNTAFEGSTPLELVAIDYGEVTYTYYASDGPGGPISFHYDRRTGEFSAAGDNGNDFQLITQFQSQIIPEPAAITMAACAWWGVVAIAAGTGRRGCRYREQG